MFDRYTERARRVIFFARYEASQLGSMTFETEHLLLGLMKEDKNIIGRFLQGPPSIQNIRTDIEGRIVIHEKVSTSIDLPLSDECMRIIGGYAAEEADRLNHRHIGTEHLLLGILREEKCMAAEILRQRGLEVNTIRQTLARPTNPPRTVNEPREHLEIGDFFSLLNKLGFIVSQRHLEQVIAARARGDWANANTELQLMMGSLVDDIAEKLNGGSSELPPVGYRRWQWLSEMNPPFFIHELNEWKGDGTGFLQGFHSRIQAQDPPDEDTSTFKLSLVLLVARLLIKRLKGRLQPLAGSILKETADPFSTGDDWDADAS